MQFSRMTLMKAWRLRTLTPRDPSKDLSDWKKKKKASPLGDDIYASRQPPNKESLDNRLLTWTISPGWVACCNCLIYNLKTSKQRWCMLALTHNTWSMFCMEWPADRCEILLLILSALNTNARMLCVGVCASIEMHMQLSWIWINAVATPTATRLTCRLWAVHVWLSVTPIKVNAS